MSEQKITFHAPVPRDSSGARNEIVVPQDKVRAVRVRSESRSGSASGQSVNIQIAMNALRRWCAIALPLGVLLAAGAAAGVYWKFEPLYEAKAFLEIKEQTPYVVFEPKEGGVSKGYFRTQIEIIKSRWIMGRTVAAENIRDLPEIRKQADPIDWLSRKVSVASPNDSDVFEIRYSSPDPDTAARVVNEVTRQYLAAQEEEDAFRMRKIVNALEEQHRDREERVRALRGQVEAAARRTLKEEPELAQSEANQPLKNPLAELQGRLIDVQVERAMLAARIKAAEEEVHALEQTSSVAKAGMSKDSAASPAKKEKPALTKEEIELRDELVERELDHDPEIRQADGRLFEAQSELEKMEKLLKQGKDDPMYKRQREAVDAFEKSIKDLKEKLRPRAIKEVEFVLRTKGSGAAGPDGVVSAMARRHEELARYRVELRGRDLAEENLRSAYGTQVTKLLKDREQLSGESLNLKFKKDELNEAQQVLARINDRLVALQTESSAPPRVILHEEAKAPQIPVETMPVSKMSLFGLMAFCLPFALAIAWEFRVRRIASPEDLEQQLHLAVLGEIARLPSRSRVGPKSEKARIGTELRLFEESVDSLRTALTLSDDLRDMRFLAITSAANHEGKTSVASQLALSLARASGKLTLLIDGDMRSPDVHQVFGVAKGPGLAEVLGEECTLSEAIVATHNPNVQLLPAGRLKVSPHRLLGNGAWASLLAQIPDRYRYVIIDTPPVLAASEALVLAKSADAVLVCVMRDVSRADQVRKASDLLTAAGGCPVGTVLNGVPIGRYKYYYGSYPSPPQS